MELVRQFNPFITYHRLLNREIRLQIFKIPLYNQQKFELLSRLSILLETPIFVVTSSKSKFLRINYFVILLGLIQFLPCFADDCNVITAKVGLFASISL